MPRDPDTNSADNTILGGPNAFLFFDRDDLRAVDPQLTVMGPKGPFSINFTPSGGELQSLGFVPGIQQLDSKKHLAGTAAIVRTPAEGLTPESYSIQGNFFDADASPTGRFSIETGRLTAIEGMAVYGETAVLSINPGSDVTTKFDERNIVAVDIASGRELWRNVTAGATGSDPASDSNKCDNSLSVGVLRQTQLDVNPDGLILYGDASGLTAADPASGETKWVSPAPRCFLGFQLPSGSNPVRLVDYNGVTAVDTRTGAELGRFASSYGVDTKRGLLVVSYTETRFSITEVSADLPALRVSDIDTGKVVFELPMAEGLKFDSLHVLAAYDGKVWIQTGPDASVIDATTGETVSNSSTLSALRDGTGLPFFQGDNWMALGSEYNTPVTFLWKDGGEFTLDEISGQS